MSDSLNPFVAIANSPEGQSGVLLTKSFKKTASLFRHIQPHPVQHHAIVGGGVVAVAGGAGVVDAQGDADGAVAAEGALKALLNTNGQSPPADPEVSDRKLQKSAGPASSFLRHFVYPGKREVYCLSFQYVDPPNIHHRPARKSIL